MGMVIISIFTAALTSSLTTLSLETKLSLPGAKVRRITIGFNAYQAAVNTQLYSSSTSQTMKGKKQL